MALEIGDREATSGMTKAIYDQLKEVMEPDLGELTEDVLSQMRDSWKKMAYAIAKGVVENIKENMEIYGIETQGNIKTAVEGETKSAPPEENHQPEENHRHSVALSGEEKNVVFTQSNDGTGHVR